MCMGGGSKPTVPPATPIPAPTVNVSEEMDAARSNQKAKAAAAGGFEGTIATSGLGDTTTPAIAKQKLGA